MTPSTPTATRSECSTSTTSPCSSAATDPDSPSRSASPHRTKASNSSYTPWPPGLIGGAYQYDIASNLAPESLSGPNAGLTEVLIPAGYVTTVYDPVFALSADGTRYVPVPSDTPTTIPEPGLPFSLVFRAELTAIPAGDAARSTFVYDPGEFDAIGNFDPVDLERWALRGLPAPEAPPGGGVSDNLVF